MLDQNSFIFGRKMDPCDYDDVPAKKIGKKGCVVVKAFPDKEIEQEHI